MHYIFCQYEYIVVLYNKLGYCCWKITCWCY